MRLSLFPLLALTLAAQTPSFEVASIRPSKSLVTPAPICGAIDQKPESVLSTESLLASAVFRLDDLVRLAYRDQVDDFDLPSWMRSDGTFSISVKVPPNTTVSTCRQMLRNLLSERFHMVTAVETRDVPRYFLTVAKSGLKLKPVDGPPADPNASIASKRENSRSRVSFHGASMPRILNIISSAASTYAFAMETEFAGVVDQTGLTGYYDGEFEHIMSVASLRSGPAESIEDSVARQLGLALELRRAPGKVLVIRSSDRTPTEN